IATYIGQRHFDAVKRSVSTVTVVALASGLLLTCLGITLARPVLEAMSAPPDVIGLAERYLRIYFCGMPFLMVYNFGSAIMRSIGDTKRPFYSLLAATVCNFALDWLFTGLLGFGVDGVAWATVISNGVNAVIIIFILIREPEPIRLRPKDWSVSRPDLRKMLQIGVPAGLQGMVFSISNIFIQSAINKFGSDAIAGSAAALTFEAYCYYIISGFCAATIAFTGQNYGAGERERCRRVARICLLYSLTLCGLANELVVWQGRSVIGLFTSDTAVVAYAMERYHTVLAFQFLASTYEIPGAYMRGLGYSVTPMVLTIFGTCVLRLGWCYVFADIDNTFSTLLTIYPVTWVATGGAVLTAAMIVQRRVFRQMNPQTTQP
ncbi:MAG: MATE family efflux transporter, partial [Muribaculaceae bacterium]|nr:MATE family efflux transporter [Muribaculaceae bacterium]